MFTDHEIRQFYALTQDMCFILGTNFHLLRANPAFLQTTGHPLETLTAQPIFEIIHESERAFVKAALEKRDTCFMYVRFLRPDAAIRLVRLTARFVPEEQQFYVVGQDVTSTIHQADLEKTLKEREIQFRLLVENMHEGFVMRDATGVITYVNKGFCNMLGKAAEAVMGTTIDQYLCESSLSLFQAETEKRKQGKSNVYELCFLNQQQPITVMVVGAPLPDSQGNYRGSFAVITDITERKNIENQLRETETRYHQMFEQNTAVKLVIDSDTGRIVDANPAAAAFYQYDRETLKTMRITDISPLPMEEAYPKFQLALSEKRTRFRFQHRLANGEIRDVDIFVGPVELEGKTLLYTIIYDVTERVKVEAVLHYIQERWNSFVKNIPVPMFLKDKEGRILYVNPAFEKQFEFHMSDWHGKNDFDLWPKAVAEKFRQDDREVLQEGKPRVMEETLSYKGEDRFWLTYKFPFVDSSGQHFLAGMTFDMTERRTVMNRALELALERERVRILSGFIEAASHEFKTPISVIQTNLYLLEKQVAPEKQKQYIQRIQDQADNLLRLVEGLVRMTELDSSVSLNRQTIDIHMLLEVVIARAASIGGRCTVTRRFGAAPATVQADAEWLGEALLEILNNAFRFTPETGEIILTTRQDGEFLKVDIQDSGIGIAPEAQPHLFERFFRADYAHSTRGFGLGLSIAKKIIELHGGEIRVTSKPGKGSIFTVVLPQSGGL